MSLGRLFDNQAAVDAHNKRVKASRLRERQGLGETVSRAVEAEETPVLLKPEPKQSFTLVLPWPPSDNYLYRPGRPHEPNQRYLTDTHRNFRQHVALLVMAAKVKPLSGRLRAEIVGFPPNGLVDMSNIVKALFDALQHAGCFANDRQIKHFSVDEVDSVDKGTITVKVSEV